MASSTSEALQNIKVHKVPNFDVWEDQYGQINGIGADDLVIIPPTSLENTIKDWIPNPEGINTPLMDGTASTGSATTWSKSDHVHPTDSTRAPTNHASTNTTYGKGTSSNYGHVKLSDSTTTTSGASDGTAATPTAVKAAYDLATTAKTTADEIISASGVTTGTSTAYILSAENFTLADGKIVKFKLHVDSGATPTLNVNGTGAKNLKTTTGEDMPSTPSGTWVTAIYSSTLDFFVLPGSASKFVPVFEIFDADDTFTVPDGGIYRITAIGAGSDGVNYTGSTEDADKLCDGGCGGAGYLEVRLAYGEQLAIIIGQSASVSRSGNTIITATAGGYTGGYYTTYAPKAGTVSGTGVTGFASNGTATKSLIVPAIYKASDISKGGDGGWSQSSRGGSFSQTGSAGGTGLYGGDGGAGGSGYAYTHNSYSDSGHTSGATASRNAGDGGLGLGLATTSGGTTYTRTHGGGGGGGAYGGGGGQPWGYQIGNQYAVYGGAGKGGAAAVIIERIE